jgi:ribosomal protein S27AE
MIIKRNKKECPKCGLKIALSSFRRHVNGKSCGKQYEKFDGNNCVYCDLLILNKGSLLAHMKCCKKNPNPIKWNRSPKAGSKKGRVVWNKGKKFENETIDRIIHQIDSGEYMKYGECNIRKKIKKYLIYKYGHKCMICDLSEWQDVKIPLVSDHIDGDSKNNEISNFRIICNNCDSILPTFKSKNRGKGRINRYKINPSVIGSNPISG